MSSSTSKSILGVVQHYQRSIEHSKDNELRLLHCIKKLYTVPIKVEHLQETGIGKTVNSLRKYNGEIGVAAKTLVNKWKEMVASEEVALDPYYPNNQVTESTSNGKNSSDDDYYDHNQNSAKKNDERKDRHKEERKRNHETKEKSQKHENGKVLAKENLDKHKKHVMKDITCNGSETTNHHNENFKPEKSAQKRHHSNDEKSGKNNREKESKKHKHHNNDREHKKDGDSCEKRIEKDRKVISSPVSGFSSNSSTPHKSYSSHTSHKRKAEDDDIDSKEKRKKLHNEEIQEKHEKHKPRKSEHKDRVSSTKSSSTKNGSMESSKKTEKHSHEYKDNKHNKSKDNKTSSSLSTSEKQSHKSDNKPSTSSSNPDFEYNIVEKKVKKNKPDKKVKIEKDIPDEDVEVDGIDSSTGANFEDVLGMLNMPMKRSKKKDALTPSVPTKAKSNNSFNFGASSVNSLKDCKPSTSSASVKSFSTLPVKTFNYSRNFDSKPELLASTVKLEPLDPSIALALPSISTNYKPIPLNPSVMDCVFNNGVSSKHTKHFDEDEAISQGISSKTMRTKIYSGYRTGQTFQPSTLFDICIRLLQRNIDALEYTGGVPFEVLRNVLERASPDQLLTFEEYNPYIMEDSDELWKAHVTRNFRAQKRQEMESWREMYIRCQDDQDRKLSALAENIKRTQKAITAPIRKTQLAFVDTFVKPPRNVLRKQEIHGTRAKLIATPAARVASLSSVTPNAAKTGDVRLRVAHAVRDPAQASSSSHGRPKRAPLMAKTLQFMKGHLKR